jgi:O-antigen/teichoic acid export membrane protein
MGHLAVNSTDLRRCPRVLAKLKDKYRALSPQIRASFWFLVCGFLQRGISVITTPIFTRILTTEEYGQYNVFSSWLSIVQVIVTLDICYGIYTQGLVKFSEERDVYSSSLQGLTLTLVTIWTVVYLVFQSFWNDLFQLTTAQMLAMLCICWANSVFTFWSAEQRVDFKYKNLVIVTIIASIAIPALGILLVLNSEDKVTARILGMAIVEMAAYSWMFFYQMRKGHKFYSKRFWKYALALNIPLIPHYLSQVALNSVDRIMISSLVGDSAAGIYSLAYSISQVMIIFNTALTQTLEPWLYHKIHDKDITSMKRVAYPAFMFVAAINLLIIALAPEIVAVFAPVEYYEAIWVIPPVSMSVYFMFAYTFFASFEFYFEKTKLISVATVVGAALNIVLNYLLIPVLGYQVAGYTTLLCYMLYAVMHYVFMRRLSMAHFGKQPYSFKVLSGMTFVFLVAGFGLMATYNVPLMRYGILFAILIVIISKHNMLRSSIQVFLDMRREGRQDDL